MWVKGQDIGLGHHIRYVTLLNVARPDWLSRHALVINLD